MARFSPRRNPPPSLLLRLVIVALALQQFIAPTWHVCSMGGHVMSMPVSDGMADHQGMMASIEDKPDDPQRPLICYCAPHERRRKYPGSHSSLVLSATPDPHHMDGTCLALLLQTMPGAIATAPALISPSTLIEAHFQSRYEAPPALAIVRHFRGRAPPVEI